MDKLLLIDGSNVLHRAFHALPLLKNDAGRYTNAVYGFLMTLQKVCDREKPTHVAVCFDKGKSTFRHKQFAAYKAKRQETPAELAEQFPLIREVLEEKGFAVLELEEYEADDIIGTLARQGQEAGDEVLILSGDKDLLQLVEEGVSVLSFQKGIGDTVRCDVAAFQERYGLPPERMVDIKALMGDSSDNIPGVPGIGEKTALKLLHQYGDLDSVYAAIDEMPANKQREKLRENRNLAYLSKDLATIVRDIPLGVALEDLKPKGYQAEKLRKLYRELGFNSLLKTVAAPAAPSLFPDLDMEEGAAALQEAEREIPYRHTVAEDREAFMASCLVAKTVALYESGGSFYIADQEGQAAAFSGAEAAALLANAGVEKIGHRTKGLYRDGLERGTALPAALQDMEIAAYLLEALENDYSLDRLFSRYLGLQSGGWEEREKPFAIAAALFPLWEVLREKLDAAGAWSLYREIELPLVKILAGMEWEGIRVDREKLREMSRDLDIKITAVQEQVYFQAGEIFNLNSPKQLQEILFHKLGLTPLRKTKTGYSTDNEVLESLAGVSPIVENILAYRQLSKLKSTYTDALEKLIDPGTGHIHTRFNQTVTATGRLSSTEPNLQNIPIRQEEGREIRKAFTASERDRKLLAADYSQIELRILAHYAEEPVLISSFVQGEDIHTRTAAEIFHVPKETVDGEMRRKAKAVNFGIIYGISDYGLGRDLGISRADAKRYIDNYFLRYPKVEGFLDGLIAAAREEGYVETLFGRRRYLPEIKSRNFNLRSFAERTAMNTPLQGTAADIIKAAMVRVVRDMEAAGLKSKLILQVHDELIFDCPAEEIAAMLPLVREAMERTVTLKVPLAVDIKVGYDWYHMEKRQ